MQGNLVAERLSTVRENLPPGIEPFITPITSIAGEIMLISLILSERQDNVFTRTSFLCRIRFTK